MTKFLFNERFPAKYGRLILAAILCLGLIIACGKNGGSTQAEIKPPGSVEELLVEQAEPTLLEDRQALPGPGFYQATCRERPVWIMLIAEDEEYLRLHFCFPEAPAGVGQGGEETRGPRAFAVLRPPLGRFSTARAWALVWQDEVLWLYTAKQGLVSLHADVRNKSVNSSLRNLEFDRRHVPPAVLTAVEQ
jgi:hypothetical protein